MGRRQMYWYNPKTRSTERRGAPRTDAEARVLLDGNLNTESFVTEYEKLRDSGMKQRILRRYLIPVPRLRIVGVRTSGVWTFRDGQQFVDGVGGITLVRDVDAVGFPLVSGTPVEGVDDMLLCPGVRVGADLLSLEFGPETGEPVPLPFSNQDPYHSAPFLRYVNSYPVATRTTLRVACPL
jgi:hypothetical protein